MRIILSPAKQMIENTDTMPSEAYPIFTERVQEILAYMKVLSYGEAKALWGCNDKLAAQNFERFETLDLQKNLAALTPAILAYDGIAFKYMAPNVFEEAHFSYVQENLRILSGFYGVLRAMDGVSSYRLEMQAKAKVGGCRDLYEFWGDAIYREVQRDNPDRIIINLASKEYSKCVEKFLKPEDRYVTCVFGEIEKGKVVQKGVYAKMARGEMVRYLAENSVASVEELRSFDRLDYRFAPEYSDESTYVFLR